MFHSRNHRMRPPSRGFRREGVPPEPPPLIQGGGVLTTPIFIPVKPQTHPFGFLSGSFASWPPEFFFSPGTLLISMCPLRPPSLRRLRGSAPTRIRYQRPHPPPRPTGMPPDLPPDALYLPVPVFPVSLCPREREGPHRWVDAQRSDPRVRQR